MFLSSFNRCNELVDETLYKEDVLEGIISSYRKGMI